VDEIYSKDQERIKVNYQLDKINTEINSIQNQIKEAYKSGKKDEALVEKLKAMKIEPENRRDQLKGCATNLKSEIDKLVFGIGNILEESVPICKTDDGNVVVRTHTGFRKIPESPKSYAELMKCYTNPEAGAEVFGHRGYFLQGKMALLARALKNYAIDFLVSKGYEFIQPPVMMRKDVMALTSQLSDFDDQLYKVEEDLYLIATSEQPLTALFINKKLTESDLPKMFAGDSLCFRKEAGAYGKDNAGIFRVHQFEKIEQFVICSPEESKQIHENLVKQCEEFYQSLGLSYQIVLISSGEMNDAAAKKYDLEAWFPNSQKFRELVSASNCTDYQSRNLNVGYGFTKENERQSYVHMLNATLCAIQRSLCCIVENYQEEDRISVPEVLKKYTNFDCIYL
ncbi:serine-tRNA ligase, partial [Vittaforma corneae ATCC 50505]